jgi:small subunit ribosomal protein S5
MKPAVPGTGIIAGASVRALVEKAGIKDLLAKSQGSRNPMNIVKATLDGLLQLRTLKEVADLREVTLKKIMS